MLCRSRSIKLAFTCLMIWVLCALSLVPAGPAAFADDERGKLDEQLFQAVGRRGPEHRFAEGGPETTAENAAGEPVSSGGRHSGTCEK